MNLRLLLAFAVLSDAAAWLAGGRFPLLHRVPVRPCAPAMSEAFLASAATAPNAKTTSSGLVYEEMVAGEGASPTLDSTVKVDYTGTLADGTVFDSSVARGVPAEFPLNKVIKGWQEGVGLMKLGGKAKLTIPASLAYGSTARPNIPANSVLQFEIELLGVTSAAPIPTDYIGRSLGSFSMGKAAADAPPKDRTGQMIGLGACGLIGLLSYTGILPS